MSYHKQLKPLSPESSKRYRGKAKHRFAVTLTAANESPLKYCNRQISFE